MRGRRDPILLLAVGASLALALTAFLLPAAPWRIPLALLGGVWAPGYALVALAYPSGRLTRLERHGLSACAGICLLPLLTLLSSESVGLTSARLAGVALAATSLLALAAARRSPGTEEPLARSMLPSTKATLALCIGALVLAAAVEAASTLTAKEAPPSLAIVTEDGPLDLALELGQAAALVVTARAGASPAEGDLEVTWDGAPLTVERIALAPGEEARVPVTLPTDARGRHELVATWLDLRTDATFRVEAP